MGKFERFLLVLLLLLTLNKITKSYIIVPFKSLDYKIPKNLERTEDVLYYLFESKYATILKVGTPEQEVLIFIKMSETYFKVNEHSYHDEKANYTFNPNKSETYNQISDQPYKLYYPKVFLAKDNIYLLTVEEGRNLTDVFTGQKIIDKSKYKNYQNISFYFSPYIEQTPTVGIIGLSLDRNLTVLPKINFLEEIKREAKLNSIKFSFSFDSKNSGLLVIGSLPHEYDPENYKKDYYIEYKIIHKPINKGDFLKFSVPLTETYFQYEKDGKIEKKYFKIGGRSNLVIDPNTYFMRVPETYMEMIKSIYFNDYIKQGKCYIKSAHSIQVIGCKKSEFTEKDMRQFPVLKFFVEDLKYTLNITYKEAFKEQGNEYIFLISNNYPKEQDFIFGYILLIKYRFTFDPENKVLGFYRINGINSFIFIFWTDKGKIAIVGVIILVLCLMMYIIIRNKYKNELKKNEQLTKLKEEEGEELKEQS